MEALLQRLSGFANAAIPFAARAGNATDNRPASRVIAAARWALWVCLLILPGSFLLLPVLLWGRMSVQRRSSRGPSDRPGRSTDPQR